MNLAESGLIQICVSKEILAEVEDMLNRLEICANFPDLNDEIVSAFLKRSQNLSELVRSVLKKFSYPNDKDDELYINLAVAVGADFIISRDRDLLGLMRSHIDEYKEFRQRFR